MNLSLTKKSDKNFPVFYNEDNPGDNTYPNHLDLKILLIQGVYFNFKKSILCTNKTMKRMTLID